MDLDNINDIETLREAAKRGRVQIKKTIAAIGSEYIFRKGFWYLMSQDESNVTIYSEHYMHSIDIPYRLADEYFESI